MASASYSQSNTGDSAFTRVTEGTSAPGAGDIEVRIDLTKGWDKRKVKIALDNLWRYIEDQSTNPIA